MHFTLTGISHKTLPIAWREKLYLKPELSTLLLAELKNDPAVAECLLLSTCNRTEMLLVFKEKTCVQRLQETLCQAVNVDPHAIRDSWYTLHNTEAVQHLFRVTASLDSLVVGETQIFGQVRDAYQLAHQFGSTATILNQLMHRAFSASKCVRSKTGLGLGALSLSSIAVELLSESLCLRHVPTLLIVGTGEMGKITAKTFSERNLGKLVIINRTFEKAQALAAELGAEARPWEELKQSIFAADAVVTSCSAEQTLLHKTELASIMADRPKHSITLVDLGVPRNIAEDVNQLENVCLFNIDNLEVIAQHNQQSREAAAADAERIVLAEARKAAREVIFSNIGAAIVELQQKYEALRKHELEKTLQQLAHLNLSESDKTAISACTESLVRKMLHEQIQHLRATEGNHEELSKPISTAIPT